MAKETKQTKVNFYTNIVALLTNIFVGIYYTPYLVKSLGLAAYGVLPLALIINQYIGVATQTLTHAYTRFYSVSLQKGDYREASKDISTSLAVVILTCSILLPISIVIIANIEYIFNIPSTLLTSARFLFVYTIMSFLASLFSSLMNVTLYAINRLDLMNILKIIRALLKLILVIAFFECIRIDVSLVGLSNFLTEGLILIISIYLFFIFKPSDVHIHFKYFDKKVLIAILSMSIWVLIQICGDTLLYRTDNLIVNHYWGTCSSGALGAISEIGSYASVAVSVLGSLFGPLILIAYAKGNHDDVKSLFIEQSTIVGCLSAVLTGIISGCGFYILTIWLGESMGIYQWWLLVKMIVIPFYAAGGILALVYRSWNKVKFPAIGTIVLGVTDVLVLILLCETAKVDVIWVLIIGAFFSIGQCFLLNAISVSKIYPDCKSRFLPITFKISAAFLICFLSGFFSTKYLEIGNVPELGLLLLILGSLMLAFVFFFILSSKERKDLISIIK